MRTVTLEVASREKTDRRVLAAFEGKPQGDFLSFETPALLFQVLTPTRWELLSALTGAGPVTPDEAAARAGRGVNAVRDDLLAPVTSGILDKADGGRMVFPYDAIHVDFFLQAAQYSAPLGAKTILARKQRSRRREERFWRRNGDPAGGKSDSGPETAIPPEGGVILAQKW